MISEIGQHYPMSANLRLLRTYNMAEYKTFILGLRLAIELNVQEILLIGDLDLLIHQVRGEWAIKNTIILPYLECVQKMCNKFHKIEFKYAPRIHNDFADA